MDAALLDLAKKTATPAPGGNFAKIFPDTYSGRQERIKAVRWLNSQTSLVARDILSQLVSDYKATFNLNNANSAQMTTYKEMLKTAQTIGTNILDKTYEAFTNDPTAIPNIQSLLQTLKLTVGTASKDGRFTLG